MAGSVRAFSAFLAEHRGGATHDELSVALQALVADVTNLQKVGTLTLAISLKPVGDGLQISARIKTKPPEEEPGVSIFYATPENNLSRQDPRQQAMELREIPPAIVARSLA